MRAVVLHGGGKGLAFVRDLIDAGVETYLLHGGSPSFAAALPGVRPRFREFVGDARLDARYPDPVRHPEAFREFVCRQVELIRPEIVFPVNAAEVTAIYPARAEIERLGAVLPLGDEETYHALRDKTRVHDLFPEWVAETRVFEGAWYAKPARQTSAKGVRRIGGDGPWVLQRAFEGYGVGFEALAENGRVLYSFMHRRKREFPARGGSSTARISFWDDAIAEAATEMIRRAGWTGFAMLEFRRDDSGAFRLIEVNPRPWGSIQLAIDGGVPFPRLAYHYFVEGKELPVNPSRDGSVETRIVPWDIASGCQYLALGQPRQFRDSLALAAPFHWEGFRPLDPRHFLVNVFMLYDGLKEFARSARRSGRAA